MAFVASSVKKRLNEAEARLSEVEAQLHDVRLILASFRKQEQPEQPDGIYRLPATGETWGTKS